jgi:hypothetical protein
MKTDIEKILDLKIDIDNLFISLLDVAEEGYLENLGKQDVEYIKQDLALLNKYNQSAFYINKLEEIIDEKENE